MELECEIQTYAWGKLGSSSAVASLRKNISQNFFVNENKPYAELWMGTHINGPSRLLNGSQTLLKVLQEHPEYVGKAVQEKFGAVDLPFLFKVLSINKALSIQAHPDKELAEELNEKFPNIYRDPNHKPELAIALTDFEALCGFRPVSEIKEFIQTIPQLKQILFRTSFVDILDETEYLKKTFAAIFSTPQEIIDINIDEMLSRFKKLDQKKREKVLADLFERLNLQFPKDIGCLMIYFLNYIPLKKGQAIYLGPNEPHAYLSGDCVECMACSDNVVRAGLTPKLIDVDTLCSMLTYNTATAADQLWTPEVVNKNYKVFKPPVPDFQVGVYEISSSLHNFEISSLDSGSIILITSGECSINKEPHKTGSVFFIPAKQSLKIENIIGELEIFQASANC